MRSVAAVLGFVLCALGVLACADGARGTTGGRHNPTAGPGVPVGSEFTLRVGETATIADTGLRVGYLKLIEDSRCPPEVTCVWEGDAVVRVSLIVAGETEPAIRELHTYDNLPQHAEQAGYRVELLEVARDGSTATFVVKR